MSFSVRVENLVKKFGDRTVLKNINLAIRRGSITAIMGRSGCGKTVLMKTIVGLLKPDSGKIWIEGEEITSASPRRRAEILRKVGFLFQGSALFDWLTVEENIAFPLVEVFRVKPSEAFEKARELIRFVGLEGSERKYPSELSGGMKKRTAIARAIVSMPPVVILDEPTSGLDPLTSSTIEDLILKIHEKMRSTFIVITHDIKGVLRIATDVVLMKDGRILWRGAKSEMFGAGEEELKLFLERLRM